MHVSNFYLSEPKYEDFGINVYGSIVGVYMRLGKAKTKRQRNSAESAPNAIAGEASGALKK